MRGEPYKAGITFRKLLNSCFIQSGFPFLLRRPGFADLHGDCRYGSKAPGCACRFRAHKGKIHTEDSFRRTVEALAVRDGKIM
jgi:hypothetical protein